MASTLRYLYPVGLLLLLTLFPARTLLTQADFRSPSKSMPSYPTFPAPEHDNARTRIGEQTPAFIENRGQWDDAANFLLQTDGLDMWITDDGVVYDLYSTIESSWLESWSATTLSIGGVPRQTRPNRFDDAEPIVSRRSGNVVRLTFAGCRDGAVIRGTDRRTTFHNYFIGNDRTRWTTHAWLYEGVRAEEIYEGIDAFFYVDEGRPRYDLVIGSGADPLQIRMRFEGAEQVSVTRDGRLRVATTQGPIEHRDLFAYQEIDGMRRRVCCSFALHADGTIGFEVGEYDRAYALVIDPLVYSTILGRSGQNRGNSIAVDDDGKVYVIGHTYGAAIPTLPGAYDVGHNGAEDVFVSKLDPSLIGSAQLRYSTYIGGTADDLGNDIAVDKEGNLYLTGDTWHGQNGNFPATDGAYDTAQNGRYDVFVTKLDPSANGADQLVYSTFLGGAGFDQGRSIAIDESGNIYVTGAAGSHNAAFPTTQGGYDTAFNGGPDAFVAKLDPSAIGSAQLVYCTLLGGKGDDRGNSIAVDRSGRVYITGHTVDDSIDFPTTPGAFNSQYNGGQDAFVAILDPSARSQDQLLYSTFIGAGINLFGTDIGYGIALDDSGFVYVAGQTGDADVDFPTTPGAFTTEHNGGQDAFVVKLDPRRTGSAQLRYATLIGGSAYDAAIGIAVRGDGIVYITGHTGDGDKDFPTTRGAYQPLHRRNEDDAFIAKLNPSASGSAQLEYSSLIGGAGYDRANSIALDARGDVYITGYVWKSPDFPTTPGAYGTTSDTTGTHTFITALKESYAITTTAIGSGFVLPGGTTIVDRGDDATFTMAPELGETVLQVLVNNVSVGVKTSYTFTDVQSDATLEARFSDASLSVSEEKGSRSSHLFSLMPNVVSGELQIDYSLSETEVVSLRIYSIDGRLIASPIREERQRAGNHRRSVDVRTLLPGIYSIWMITGTTTGVRQFLVVR